MCFAPVLSTSTPLRRMWKQSLTSLPASDVKWMLSCTRRFHGPDRLVWERLVATGAVRTTYALIQ